MQQNISLEKSWSFFVLSMLFLSFYYLSYRYPLQMNSSDTSQTYSDTTFVFQFGKYAIFAGLLFILILFLLKLRPQVAIKKKTMLELFIAIFLFVMPMAQFVLSLNDWVLQTGLFFILLVLFYMFPFKRIDYKRVSRAIMIFVVIAIIVEVYQLANFYINGRLPALGWAGTISVRFGSIWDDPNAFALFLPFLMPFVWKSELRFSFKVIIQAALVATLIFTQSLTGIAALIVSIVFGVFFMFFIDKKRSHFKTFLLFAVVSCVMFAGFKMYVQPSEFYETYMELKEGSIEGHKVGFLSLDDADAAHFLGFNPQPHGKYAETGYINLLLNFGIFYTAGFLILGLTTIWRLAVFIKNNQGKKYIEIFYGAYFFVIAFYAALANLPVEVIFPLNLLLVVCIMISYADPLTEERKEKVRRKRKRYRLTW